MRKLETAPLTIVFPPGCCRTDLILLDMKVSKVEINNQYLRYPEYSRNDIVKADKATPP